MNKIIKTFYFIIEAILYGAKELTIGLGVIAALFLFFVVLIFPPMYSFDLFVEGELLYGSLWLLISLFIYGIGFKSA